jgi:hypothetical protein
MIIVLIYFILVAILVWLLWVVVRRNDQLKRLNDQISELNSQVGHADDMVERLTEEADTRNTLLDYLFRQYYLNKPNPYILMPGYEEKRCYHCFYPEYAGHDATCAWQHCRPVTEGLYPAPAAPVEASDAVPEGNTLLPIPPTDDDVEGPPSRIGKPPF